VSGSEQFHSAFSKYSVSNSHFQMT